MKYILTIIALLLSVSVTASTADRRTKKKARKVSQVVKAKPRTTGPFVVRIDAPRAPDGLEGRNIALWPSHGRYYDGNEGRWMWQRSRLLGTVEDLLSRSYVLPYLATMLEDAGAYVMMPCERDLSAVEVIVDGDGGYAQAGYAEKNGSRKWEDAKEVSGFAYVEKRIYGTANPFTQGTVRKIRTVTDIRHASSASWCADIPQDGEYAVYVSYASLPESANDACYRINSRRGIEEIHVNQTMGGGTWIYLGTYPIQKGLSTIVELINVSADDDRIVTADAIKIGGGVGNISRGDATSGYPRFTEGARYWLQWAGIPDSVYSFTAGINDYEDDYKSRGLWVNYLAGGSKSIPGKNGLGIPIDLSFALHTDAGTAEDGVTTVGTLPIVSTAGGILGNGKSRKTSATYASMVTNQIVDDIWRLYEPQWTRRKMRDRQYHEAREPQVPAMLLELMSHQNFADMRYGLNPAFRFDVCRAIYKGILKYIHEAAGTPYTVSPLPVRNFAATGKSGEYTLTWSPTDDPLEPTADAEYYIVYERIDDGAFVELAITDDTYLPVTPQDDRIYSYKIVAANTGGLSFPSETLALCNLSDGKEQVTVVNGFTRISGPDGVYRDGCVGFDYEEDFGVPYIRDISFSGVQTEFRPGAVWKSNDAPGHGASRATHETRIIAGNTFDFAYIHGRAIKAAGHSFISMSVDAFANSIDSPRIIDLILGKQKEIAIDSRGNTRYKTFFPELKQRLVELADSGACIMVSGSYIGHDLYDNRFSTPSVSQSDREFGNKILGIKWSQPKATATGEVKGLKSMCNQVFGDFRFSFNQQLSSEIYAVESPESFSPVDIGGSVILRYSENDYPAATAFVSDRHRAVALGFPFETINEPKDSNSLMSRILEFLSSKPAIK